VLFSLFPLVSSDAVIRGLFRRLGLLRLRLFDEQLFQFFDLFFKLIDPRSLFLDLHIALPELIFEFANHHAQKLRDSPISTNTNSQNGQIQEIP